MIGLLVWLIAFPTVLYHCFFAIALVLVLICYKISLNKNVSQHHSLQHQSFRLKVANKFSQVMRGRRYQQSASRAPHLALALLMLITSNIMCLEQDAKLMRPLASFAKSIINTITLGVPLSVDFGATDLAKSLVQFSWRTGFPVTMPSGFFDKSQEFYNRVRDRVAQTDVKGVERKSLKGLKEDLDNIVDGIVEHVRQSPDGLYTNYEQTMVKGVPLEDASVAVGVQLKAYGVDLTNYRNIAGAVLGVPMMPTIASTMVDVASFAPSIGAVTNSTRQVVYNPIGTMSELSGSALGSLGNLRQNLPPISSPLSLFGGSQSQPAQAVSVQ